MITNDFARQDAAPAQLAGFAQEHYPNYRAKNSSTLLLPLISSRRSRPTDPCLLICRVINLFLSYRDSCNCFPAEPILYSNNQDCPAKENTLIA